MCEFLTTIFDSVRLEDDGQRHPSCVALPGRGAVLTALGHWQSPMPGFVLIALLMCGCSWISKGCVMNRVLGVLVLAVIGLGLWPGAAHAVMFVDLVEFGGPELGPGDLGSIEVRDNVTPPVWLHDLADDIGGLSLDAIDVTDASLRVFYRGTNGVEVWTLLGDGQSLGVLASTDLTILSTEFPLTGPALEALRLDGALQVIPKESTSGIDRFRLYRAELSGNYLVRAADVQAESLPIPEPATGVLLGASMSWLGFSSLKRKRRLR